MATASVRPYVFNRRPLMAVGLLIALVLGLSIALPGFALDLVAFTGITGPLVSALTQISALGPGIKALVGRCPDLACRAAQLRPGALLRRPGDLRCCRSRDRRRDHGRRGLTRIDPPAGAAHARGHVHPTTPR
jgi:hypothetical protein